MSVEFDGEHMWIIRFRQEGEQELRVAECFHLIGHEPVVDGYLELALAGFGSVDGEFNGLIQCDETRYVRDEQTSRVERFECEW